MEAFSQSIEKVLQHIESIDDSIQGDRTDGPQILAAKMFHKYSISSVIFPR
jgi:hypothetical protein